LTLNPRSVILFDGYCHLCSRSVRFISKRDKKKLFTFIPINSKEAQQLLGLHGIVDLLPETVILFENSKIYQKSTAILRIARLLGFPWSIFYAFIIVPEFIRDWIYLFIARRRYRWFGKRETCYIP